MAFSKTPKDPQSTGGALFEATNARILETAFMQIEYLKKGLAKYPPQVPIPPKLALRGTGDPMFDLGYLLPHGPRMCVVRNWDDRGVALFALHLPGQGVQLAEPPSSPH